MKKLLFITIFTLNALSIFAQTQKFDIMTFTLPKGWEAKPGDNAKMYSKVDNAKNTFGIIIVYPSIDSKGSAADDFKFVWKQIVQDTFGASAKPETETAQDKGFTIVNGGELITYAGNKALAMLTVLSGKSKAVSILTITNEQSYANVTQSLLESISINVPASPKQTTPTNSSSQPTSPSSGKLAGNGIEGVWLCYTNNFPFSTDMIWKERVFFNDGTFIQLIPHRGLFNASFTEKGNYNFKNGNGTMRASGSQYTDQIVQTKANTIKIGTEFFNKSIDATGKKFTGSFTSFSDPNDPVLKAQPIGNRTVINFYNDGTFYDEGIFKRFAIGGGTANDLPGKGKYEIREYTVFFNYDDGRKRQAAFYAYLGNDISNINKLFVEKIELNKMK
jgi:hypothetical protein